MTHYLAARPLPSRLIGFPSGDALLASTEPPDVARMDIRLGGVDGMAAVRRLRGLGNPCQVIFLTAYPQYVFDAFDLDAVHYCGQGLGHGSPVQRGAGPHLPQTAEGPDPGPFTADAKRGALMLFYLWWGAVNALIAWGEAVFLCRVLSRRPRVPLWPCPLSMVLLTGLATASLLSPLASLLLHLAVLLCYARLALGARVCDCALPVLCLLVFSNLRVSFYTVLLSCLSRMLSGQSLGLALQILLSFALARLQLWALWALSWAILPWNAPKRFLLLLSALLLGALWFGVGLGGEYNIKYKPFAEKNGPTVRKSTLH